MDNVLEKYFDELEEEGFDFTIKESDKKYMDKDYNAKYTKKYHGNSPPPELEEEYMYHSEDEVSTPIFTDDEESEQEQEQESEQEHPDSIPMKINSNSLKRILADINNINIDDKPTNTVDIKQQTNTTTVDDRVFVPTNNEVRDLEYDRMLATDPEMQKVFVEKLLQTSIACAGNCIKTLVRKYLDDGSIPSMDVDFLPDTVDGHVELGLRDDKRQILYVYGFGLKIVDPNYQLIVPPNLVAAREQVTQNIIPSLFKRAVFLYNYVKKMNDSLENDSGPFEICPLQNGNDCPLIILVNSDISKHSDTPWNDTTIGIGIDITESIRTFAELAEAVSTEVTTES